VNYGVISETYIRPEVISAKLNKKMREEKEIDIEMWRDLLEKARYEMPGATEERLKAIVFS
jgi:hypothetical protein